MNFNTLRYVIAVAKERSFSKAAQSLCVSQPTLSQSIRVLEKRLGAPIFDRKTYPVTPTYTGKLYIEFAQQVLLYEAQISRRIMHITTNSRVRLRIGVSPSRSTLIMPEIIHKIYMEFPDCIISLEDSVKESELFMMLENKAIDIMLGSPPSNTLKFKSQIITDEHLVFAVPKEFAFPGKPECDSRILRKINLIQLRDLPFIVLPQWTFLGLTLRILCEKENFNPEYSIECTNVLTAYRMASQGIGIALTTELNMLKEPYYDTLNYYILQHDNPIHRLAVITNRDESLSHPAERFIDLMMKQYSGTMGI